MLVLVWSTFCNQFATGVFTRVSKETIILVAFLNVGLYIFLSIICLLLARPPFPSSTSSILPSSGKQEPQLVEKARRIIKSLTFGKRETAAICFCAAAKGVTVLFKSQGHEF
jgi:sodium/bile acid cotransporter 7